MAFVTLASILSSTRKQSYAVGAFNFNGIEDSRGILDAAIQKKSPVILMASVSAVAYFGGPEAIAGFVQGITRSLEIPVALHLDHAEELDLIFSCVDAGFTSVMIDASKKSYEENIAITREVVQYAHEQSVSVEAELGKIGGREENISVSAREASMTDPKAVPEFVSRTGIDALAVAIGTAHGFYKEDPLLDFERLEKIRSLTDTPLVLHGGTGLTEADFIHCVKSGISKINVGTELKYCCSQTVRKSVETQPDQIDIRKLVGPARKNCEEIVLKKIELFGSANKR